jgi:hypothetical protein
MIARGKAIENENEPSQNLPENEIDSRQQTHSTCLQIIEDIEKLSSSLEKEKKKSLKKIKEEENRVKHLEKDHWKELLVCIHGFFETYKREQNIQEARFTLTTSYFKQNKDDKENRIYPLVLRTAQRYKKVYDNETIKEWIRDDLKEVSSDIIDKYKEGDSYEEVVEKVENLKEVRAASIREKRNFNRQKSSKESKNKNLIENENEPSQNLPENEIDLRQSNFTNYLSVKDIIDKAEALQTEYDENKRKLDNDFWQKLLPIINHFFAAYKADERINQSNFKLTPSLFLQSKEDTEPRRYPILIRKVQKWKKIYDSETLKAWIDDETFFINSDIIDKYQEGDSYEETKAKAEERREKRNFNRQKSSKESKNKNLIDDMNLIINNYDRERAENKRQLTQIENNFWNSLLPKIIEFFNEYKVRYPDRANPNNVRLEGKKFKKKADDEGKEFPFLYETVTKWKKIYLFPALQEWIQEPDTKITLAIIECYGDGDTYEQVLEKVDAVRKSQKKNRLKRATSGRGVREFTEAQKKRIAGKQYFQCANRPNSELERSINYQCPLWQVDERDGSRPKGNFGPEGYEIDHIIPVSEEGRSVEENGQALCHYCHKMKGQMDRERTNEISNLMGYREMDSSETEDLDFSETEDLDFSESEEDDFV